MNRKENPRRMSTGATAACLSRTRLTAALKIVVAVLMLGLMCVAQSSDESLGDVARQNKPSRKAARVVTNDEIPSVAVPVAETTSAAAISDKKDSSENEKASSAPAQKNSAAKSSKAGITVPGVLENGTLSQAQAALEGLKHDRQALLDNYEQIERQLGQTDNALLRDVYSGSLARRDKVLAKNAKAIQDTEDAIRAAQSASEQGENK